MFKNVFGTALILLAFLLSGCSLSSKPADQTPEDFGFILKYGIGAKNELDTFQGTFTKDLIMDGTKSTELVLTGEELNEIYTGMKQIGLEGYPASFAPRTGMSVTPYQTYSLKVRFDGKEKDVFWDDEANAQNKQAVKLRGLIKKIVAMVEAKKEFQKLPPSRGFYQ